MSYSNKIVCLAVLFIIQVNSNVIQPIIINQKVKNACGYSKLENNTETVVQGEFPWLGGLFNLTHDKRDPHKYLCTVNLITKKHVLTAGHCVKEHPNPAFYRVIMGILLPEQHRAMEVTEVLIHPEHDAKTIKNDIAILTTEIVTFNETMRPICLILPEGVDAFGYFAGFGPDYTSCRKLRLNIVSKRACRENHSVLKMWATDKTACVNGTHRANGPCKGDSGAGFVQEYNGRFYLKGIVSFSVINMTTQKCDPDVYIAMADVTGDYQWIKKELHFYLN